MTRTGNDCEMLLCATSTYLPTYNVQNSYYYYYYHYYNGYRLPPRSVLIMIYCIIIRIHKPVNVILVYLKNDFHYTRDLLKRDLSFVRRLRWCFRPVPIDVDTIDFRLKRYLRLEGRHNFANRTSINSL